MIMKKKRKSNLSIRERWWVLRKQDMIDSICLLDPSHSPSDKDTLSKLLDEAYNMGKKSTRKYYQRILNSIAYD